MRINSHFLEVRLKLAPQLEIFKGAKFSCKQTNVKFKKKKKINALLSSSFFCLIFAGTLLLFLACYHGWSITGIV